MKNRSPWRRAGSGTLLAAVLAVGALQAAVEVREVADTGAAYEGEHQTTCLRLHDHRFCVFSGREPWVRPSPVVHAPWVPAVHRAADAVVTPRPLSRSAFSSVQPRSPPVST